MGHKAHRHGDTRNCGATTTVQNQSTVYVNGKLWAVEGSHNSHGNGGLVATGSTVFVENKKIIVNTPDNSQQDNLCPPLGGNHCNPKTSAGSDDVFAY